MNIFRYRTFLPARSSRTGAGSILAFTVIAAGLVLFICLATMCFYLFVVQENSGTRKAERDAVELAKILNDGDRVGQINNLISRSRELVYLSRLCQIRASQKGMDNWDGLAEYLLTEAREDSRSVEAERQNQIRLLKKAILEYVSRKNAQAGTKPALSLPFWESGQTEIVKVTLGWTVPLQSNIHSSTTYVGLRKFDEDKGYFEKVSELYLGNINALLPSPENDLHFNLASIPAPVGNSIAPARIIRQTAFKPAGTIFENKKFVDEHFDQIPTAVCITEVTRVKAMGTKEDETATACAIAPGALPPP